MKKIILSLLLCVLSLSAFAYEWTDTNGVTWEFDIDANGAWIRSVDNCPAEVTVPETVKNGETPYTVYCIGHPQYEGYRCGFSYNTTITSVVLPSTLTKIGNEAFYGCSSLTSVGDLSSCESIGSQAFSGCYALTTVGDLSSCTSIGEWAFSGCYRLEAVHLGATIPTLGSSAFHDVTLFYVPQAQLDAYRAATGWSSMRTRILAEDATHDYNKTVTVSETSSAVLSAVGESNAADVVSLKVTGNINSYDIFAIRNKMPALRHLDLSEAHIVACPTYKYYGSYSTEDNIIGSSMFRDLGITDILLPQDITSIGYYAFEDCENLRSVEIPASVMKIETGAFQSCGVLRSVTFHEGLQSLGESVFSNCPITSITLPNTLQTMSSGVFSSTSLKEITIPASVRSIGSSAFPSSVRKVYVAVVDPFVIRDNTFSDYKNCDLYVPKTDEWEATYWKYYWNTQWGQFASLNTWEPTYDNFYITNDYELDGGTIRGEEDGEGNEQAPDADFGAGSGFIVDGNGHQNIDEGHLGVETDGNGNITSSGSLIGGADGNGNANLHINTLYCDIKVIGGRWYFFAFPFNVELTQVTCKRDGRDVNTVWRYYDGEGRANHGIGSNWKNQNSATDPSTLVAGVGYIFQANQNSVLSIPMSNVSSTGEQNHDLKAHASTDAANADWNFTGNPYLSYYEIGNIHTFDAPITVWNGSGYEAVRPGDDDYTFTPFQAFFVQKPAANVDNVGFDPAHRETYNQNKANAPARAAARAARAQVNPDRLIVNLTLTDGNYTDKTRVVYNNAHTMDYEAACDAAKFFSSEAVPQLYTTHMGTDYAINERPMTGDCQLGYVAPAAGELTLTAVRMDMPLRLRDMQTGLVFDLSLGDYTFQTTAGTFPARFILEADRTVTGIADILQQTGVSVMANEQGINLTGINDQEVNIFSVSGQQVAASVANGVVALPQGTYLVQVNDLTTKTIVR